MKVLLFAFVFLVMVAFVEAQPDFRQIHPTFTSSIGPDNFFLNDEGCCGTDDGWFAFRNNTASSARTTTTPFDIIMDINTSNGVTVTLVNYSVWGSSVGQATRDVNTWDISISTDNTTYTIVDYQAGQTSWGAGEERTFGTNRNASFAARYIKFHYILNNGDGTDQLAEVVYRQDLNAAPAETTRPVITNINLTSGNPPAGDAVEAYTTNDTTPTFTFTTDINANCRIGRVNVNHTAAGVSRDCSGGQAGTAHTCTVIASDALPPTTQTNFLSCVDSTDSANQTLLSTSGQLDVYVQGNDPLIIDFPFDALVTNASQVNLTNSTVAPFNVSYFRNGTFIKYLTGNTTGLGLPAGESDFTFIFANCYVGNCSINTSSRFFTHDNISPTIGLAANSDTLVFGDSFLANLTTSDGTNTSALIDFNRSLVGWWRFEDFGTTAIDSSSYGNDGTLTNAPNYTFEGRRGKGLFFDGDNDHVDLGGADNIDSITGDLTIMAWIKKERTGDATIVSTHQGKNDNTRPYDLVSFGTPGLRIGNSTAQFVAQGGTIVLGQWHHLAGTISGTSITFYLDGVVKGTTTFVGTRLTGTKVIIGASTTSGGRQLNGTADEVQIWRRALSAEEVNASFNNGLYRLERTFTGLPAGSYNFTAYVVDSSGQSNQIVSQNVTVDDPANATIALNGLHRNITYEFGTTATLNGSLNGTTRTVCIDIYAPGYSRNESCSVGINTSTSFNITWDVLREVDFLDGGRSKVIVNRTGLVGEWKFDERTGVNASDSSDKENHGVLTNGPVYNLTNFKFGSAIEFDGVNDYVSISDSQELRLNTTSGTVAAWIFPSSNQETDFSRIVDKNQGGTSGWSLRLNENNATTFNINNVGGNSIAQVITPNEWNFVVGVFDNAGGHLYVNGVNVTNVAGIGRSPLNVAGAIRIGQWVDASGRHFNGTIDEVQIWNRALSSEEVLTSYRAGEFFIPLDNRTFLQNISFNLTGLGNPENVTLFINSDREEVVLPGKLNGSVLVQKQFISNSKSYETLNLSFGSAGLTTIFVNLSTAEITRLGVLNNLTINVSGFDIDSGNEINKKVTFNVTDYAVSFVNRTGLVSSDAPNGTWEDFGFNRTKDGVSRWDSTRSGVNDDDNVCSINEYKFDNSTRLDANSINTDIDCDIVYWTTEFDVRNVTRIDIDANINGTCSVGSSGGPSCTVSVSFIVTDGTTVQTFYKKSVSAGSPDPFSEFSEDTNLSLVRRPGSVVWDVFEDNVLDNTFTVTLPTTGTWYVGGRVATLGQGPAFVEKAKLDFNRIIVGSVMSSLSAPGVYNTKPTVTSDALDETLGNIVGATLTAVDLSQSRFSSVNVTYELSNNNGTTWKDAILGERIVFDTSSSDLVWRVNCTIGDSRDTCFVSQVGVEVVGGSVSNLTFDFGSDGIQNFRIEDKFNPPNTSVLVTNLSNSLFTYVENNCLGSTTCAVPIAISTGSGGIVQITEFNFTKQMTRFFLNTSLVDDITNMRFSVNFTQGSVRVNDINADYRGTKSFGVSAIFIDNQGNAGSNSSLNVTIRYSPFNVSLPKNIDFYEVFFSSRTAKDVTPRGQGSTRPIWNITNQAYDTDINISIRVNQTYDFYNITFSRNNTKTSSLLLTNSSLFLTNVTFNRSAGVWAWHDINVTNVRFFIDYFDFSSICSECNPTFDRFDANVFLTD